MAHSVPLLLLAVLSFSSLTLSYSPTFSSSFSLFQSPSNEKCISPSSLLSIGSTVFLGLNTLNPELVFANATETACANTPWAIQCGKSEMIAGSRALLSSVIGWDMNMADAFFSCSSAIFRFEDIWTQNTSSSVFGPAHGATEIQATYISPQGTAEGEVGLTNLTDRFAAPTVIAEPSYTESISSFFSSLSSGNCSGAFSSSLWNIEDSLIELPTGKFVTISEAEDICTNAFSELAWYQLFLVDTYTNKNTIAVQYSAAGLTLESAEGVALGGTVRGILVFYFDDYTSLISSARLYSRVHDSVLH